MGIFGSAPKTVVHPEYRQYRDKYIADQRQILTDKEAAKPKRTTILSSDAGGDHEVREEDYNAPLSERPFDPKAFSEGMLSPTLQAKKLAEQTGAAPMMDQTAFYTDKYKKEEAAWIQDQAKLKAEQESLFDKVRKEQADALAAATAEQEAAKAKKAAEIAAEEEAARQKEIARRAEEERLFKITSRDTLLSDREKAAKSATDHIANLMAQEKSNADLFGVKYDMDENATAKRVSEHFSEIWGEEEENQLTGLVKEVGAPEGFTDFAVKRVQGTDAIRETSPGQKRVSTSKGMKLNTSSILAGDEPAGNNTLLGG